MARRAVVVESISVVLSVCDVRARIPTDVEICRFVCSTNAAESITAQYRRAIRTRAHLPAEQGGAKCLYLVT